MLRHTGDSLLPLLTKVQQEKNECEQQLEDVSALKDQIERRAHARMQEHSEEMEKTSADYESQLASAKQQLQQLKDVRATASKQAKMPSAFTHTPSLTHSLLHSLTPSLTHSLLHSLLHALPHAHTIVAGLVEADVSGTLASSSTLEAIDAAASNHRLRITMLHCSPHGHVGLDRVVRSLSSHAVACVKLCRCTHHLTLGEHQLADAKCSVVLK